MSKKSIAILWGLNIALYIANIVLICIKGPTLTTCILGWVLASILAGLIIFLQFRLIEKEKSNEKLIKEYNLLKQIEDFINKYGIDKTLTTIAKIRADERKKVCEKIRRCSLRNYEQGSTKVIEFFILAEDLDQIERQNQATADEINKVDKE